MIHERVQRYSHMFSTLYDQQESSCQLGRGTHFSVCRLLAPDASFHDFAIIWDEDHDLRVVYVIEKMIEKYAMWDVLFVGERKGHVCVITRGRPNPLYSQILSRITSSLPSDSFGCDIEAIGAATGSIINAKPDDVRQYLRGIDAGWQLGSKPLTFTTAPYRPSIVEGSEVSSS